MSLRSSFRIKGFRYLKSHKAFGKHLAVLACLGLEDWDSALEILDDDGFNAEMNGANATD